MKKLYVSVASMFLLLTCCYCQRTSFEPESMQQDYLEFGKGGGMTNQVTTYYILADGHVYQHDNLQKEYQHLGRLNRADRAACFEKAQQLPDKLFGCDTPGNIYYFLSVHTQDTPKTCTWGSQGFTSQEVLSTFYQYTQQLVNDLSL